MSVNAGSATVPPFPPDYRASGLLLHVTSLPSLYGIGDLRSEEHTSELQSLTNLVCRLLLEIGQ